MGFPLRSAPFLCFITLATAVGSLYGATPSSVKALESHELVLPGGKLRLVATRTRVTTDLPEFQGLLALRSAGKTVWTTAYDGFHVEGLELADLDRNGRFEAVVFWRGQGRGQRLLLDVWDPSRTPPVLIFSLPSPAYEGQGSLRGDPYSGHVSIVVKDSLTGMSYIRPFLRRTRRWYLTKGVLRKLSESYGKAKTLRQRFALSEALLARGLDRRAHRTLKGLYRACRKKGTGERQAAMLLAVSFVRLKSLRRAKRLAKRWDVPFDMVLRKALRKPRR